MDENKSKALAAALSQIEKQYGKGSIMRMDDAAIKDIDVVSTGSLGLDLALGVGGLPRGRVVEIYGPESSGKTTLTLQVIAEMQKVGGTAAFIDAENALDIAYAERQIQAQRAGGHHVDVLDGRVVHPHDGALAVLLFDLRQCRRERLLPVVVHFRTSSVGCRHLRRVQLDTAPGPTPDTV